MTPVRIHALIFVGLVILCGIAGATINSSVKLYLPMNSSLIDESTSAHTITNYNVTINTSIYKFGGGSGFFNGTAYLTTPGTTDFAFGSNDFTVAMWVNLTETPTYTYDIWDSRVTDYDPYRPAIFIGSKTNLRWYINGAGLLESGTGAFPAGKQTYIVFTRKSGILYMYINGTLTKNAIDITVYQNNMTNKFGRYFASSGSYPRANLDDILIINGYGIDGNVVPTTEFISNPSAAETANVTEGYAPLPIRFTSTSTGDSITTYNWSYTKYPETTPVYFGSSSVQDYTFNSEGNYSISLTVTNTFGSSTVSPLWANVTGSIPAASFTSSSNPVSVTTQVIFTDTSVGAPSAWNWSFDNRTTWLNGSTQNPTHLFSTHGAYNVTLVCNNTIGISDPYDLTQIVTNASGYVAQDLEQIPQYTLTLHFTDSTTNAVIPVVIVTTSSWQTYTTTNGTAYFTEPYSTVVVYASATGYVSTSHSYVMDSDRDETIQMVPAGGNDVQQQVYPHYVTFHVKEGFGSPLDDVNISVIGVSTSTGNWDWISQLLGLPLDEIPINGTYMNQSTDSLGRATFYLIPTGKYNITFTKTGYTITPMVLVPQDTDYVVFATDTDEPYFRDGVDEISAVNISITTTAYNESYSFINLTYLDSTGKTTGGTIQVLQKSDTPWAANTVMATWPVTGNSFTNSTAILHIQQVSGYVSANITHTSFGYVTRSYPYAFNSVPVQFLGFGQDIALLVALGMMVFTLMLAGAAHVRPVLFLVCVEGWVFDAMHWFDSMIDRGVPHEAIWTALTIASIIAVLANFEMRKKKEKY